MGLSPQVKETLDKFNPFKPPKEAEEAGHADFRPVSGWRRECYPLTKPIPRS